MRRLLPVLLGALVACSDGVPTTPVRFHVGARTVTIHAEVADDEAERQRGLMGRRSLPGDRGMLFVWPEEAVRSFYMYRTLIPLEIVGILDGAVTGVYQMVPCPDADPARCPTTTVGRVDAALEVTPGTAAREGIVRGTRVSIG